MDDKTKVVQVDFSKDKVPEPRADINRTGGNIEKNPLLILSNKHADPKISAEKILTDHVERKINFLDDGKLFEGHLTVQSRGLKSIIQLLADQHREHQIILQDLQDQMQSMEVKVIKATKASRRSRTESIPSQRTGSTSGTDPITPHRGRSNSSGSSTKEIDSIKKRMKAMEYFLQILGVRTDDVEDLVSTYGSPVVPPEAYTSYILGLPAFRMLRQSLSVSRGSRSESVPSSRTPAENTRNQSQPPAQSRLREEKEFHSRGGGDDGLQRAIRDSAEALDRISALEREMDGFAQVRPGGDIRSADTPPRRQPKAPAAGATEAADLQAREDIESLGKFVTKRFRDLESRLTEVSSASFSSPSRPIVVSKKAGGESGSPVRESREVRENKDPGEAVDKTAREDAAYSIEQVEELGRYVNKKFKELTTSIAGLSVSHAKKLASIAETIASDTSSSRVPSPSGPPVEPISSTEMKGKTKSKQKVQPEAESAEPSNNEVVKTVRSDSAGSDSYDSNVQINSGLEDTEEASPSERKKGGARHQRGRNTKERNENAYRTPPRAMGRYEYTPEIERSSRQGGGGNMMHNPANAISAAMSNSSHAQSLVDSVAREEAGAAMDRLGDLEEELSRRWKSLEERLRIIGRASMARLGPVPNPTATVDRKAREDVSLSLMRVNQLERELATLKQHVDKLNQLSITMAKAAASARETTMESVSARNPTVARGSSGGERNPSDLSRSTPNSYGSKVQELEIEVEQRMAEVDRAMAILRGKNNDGSISRPGSNDVVSSGRSSPGLMAPSAVNPAIVDVTSSVAASAAPIPKGTGTITFEGKGEEASPPPPPGLSADSVLQLSSAPLKQYISSNEANGYNLNLTVQEAAKNSSLPEDMHRGYYYFSREEDVAPFTVSRPLVARSTNPSNPDYYSITSIHRSRPTSQSSNQHDGNKRLPQVAPGAAGDYQNEEINVKGYSNMEHEAAYQKSILSDVTIAGHKGKNQNIPNSQAAVAVNQSKVALPPIPAGQPVARTHTQVSVPSAQEILTEAQNIRNGNSIASMPITVSSSALSSAVEKGYTVQSLYGEPSALGHTTPCVVADCAWCASQAKTVNTLR